MASDDGGRTVYPRVCGGTAAAKRSSPRCRGLSPRVRGNRLHTVARRKRACEVYPRVCGGTAHRCGRLRPIAGLSPRVRGNPSDSHRGRPAHRSIPACAGEPRLRWHTWQGPGVYPRVCGGTHHRGIPQWQLGGLSPRVRGNHTPIRAIKIRTRSIPACAGEPFCVPACHDGQKVYPRVCGGTWSSGHFGRGR